MRQCCWPTEPTASLDAEAADEVIALLTSVVAEHATLVCVVHDLDLVPRLAERVIVLRRGQTWSRTSRCMARLRRTETGNSQVSDLADAMTTDAPGRVLSVALSLRRRGDCPSASAWRHRRSTWSAGCTATCRRWTR